MSAVTEEFADELAPLLGDNLSSLLLYGSAARGDFDPKRSDVNLLLIVRDASPAALRALAPAITRWTRRGQPPPLIFTAQEWRDSTDVFAMEVEEMRQAHRVLKGENPLDGLETSPADLRHELEREARGKLVHLRAEFIACESDGRALGGLLLRSAKAFFVLFRTLLRLNGHVPPREPEALVAVTAELVGFDAGTFDWILAGIRGKATPRLKPYDPTAVRYVEVIEQVVRFIDEMA